MSNGRVNIKSTDTSQLFKMYDRMPVNECVTFRGPTEGLWNDTQLSYVFFSQVQESSINLMDNIPLVHRIVTH